MSDLTTAQWKLYNQLQNAITNQGNVAKLLKEVSRDDLLAILTTEDIHEQFSDGAEYTLTPLGLAIYSRNYASVEVILDVAKEQGILKEVLNNTSITLKRSNVECTVTLLGWAIQSKNQEVVKVILDAAKEQDILKVVLAGIRKDGREEVKGLLKKAEDQDMLDKILEVERSIESEAVKVNPSSNGNTAKITNKSIIIDCIYGAIFGFAVGFLCFAYDVALPISAIVGIAVAVVAAVVLINTTDAVPKPSSKMKETNAQEQNFAQKVVV